VARRYDPCPSYPARGGRVEQRLIAALPGRPMVDVRMFHPPWGEVERRTADGTADDPVFRRLWSGPLADLFGELPRVDEGTIVFGPGSALVAHDELWYADVPKRLALAAVRHGETPNVGQPAGARGTEQRLLFVDWPMLDRHKQALLPQIDRYVDFADPLAPLWLAGDALRGTFAGLARQPFRTRPTFLPGPWGGHWLQRELGVERDAPNLAWSYELIAPEATLLVDGLEVGLELLLAAESKAILGPEVAARFAPELPIRFDYLDTLEGGHLSVQCHPSERYARETFGLSYTQHETYYVLQTTPGAKVFLGLRDDADVGAFERDARAALEGRTFDPARHLQLHDAEQHRLYAIPAGTPHASGAGNVVLEISATPYLYTLRFYDWLRRDLEGTLRPVHLDHAFANLDPRRRGAAVVRDLVAEPTVVRSGEGWAELELGRVPELFFAAHRLDFDDTVEDDTGGRFHVLNLVEGEEVSVEPSSGDPHGLTFAETLIVPAAVGAYRLVRRSGPPAKVVKAFVKPAT
jgi:mannose-6-phosphate isomerase class I